MDPTVNPDFKEDEDPPDDPDNSDDNDGTNISFIRGGGGRCERFWKLLCEDVVFFIISH